MNFASISFWLFILILLSLACESALVEAENKLLYKLKKAFKRVHRRFYGHYIEKLRRSLH